MITVAEVECAKELWQEWTLPVGMIRINHVHGQVWIGRGRTHARLLRCGGTNPQCRMQL